MWREIDKDCICMRENACSLIEFEPKVTLVCYEESHIVIKFP